MNLSKFTLNIVLCFYTLILSIPAFSNSEDCKKEAQIKASYEELAYTFDEPFILQNPYGRNPLSALIKFPTEKPAQIELTILPKKNEKPIKQLFKEFKEEHDIPILGLFANFENKILLKAIYKNGTTKQQEITISTPKIQKRALFVIENKTDTDTDYYYFHGGIVFDDWGNLRLSFLPDYEMLYFLNNEFVAEDRNLGLIRYNMLGKKIKTYSFPKGFTSFTHGITQKPNKNFLVIGSFNDQYAVFEGEKAQTQRDFVIELDYQTGKLVNKIDLAELLNPDRSVIIKSNTKNYGINNWCHINSVSYDEKSKGILVSCRHAGLIKINEKDNQIDYIISPHNGFEKSGRLGNGPALFDKLLTALDKNNTPLDKNIQNGIKKHPDFKWPTKTHDAKIVSDNIVSVFDNSGTLYDKATVSTQNSNAQVFLVNSDKKTIQNIYFKPLDFYSESGSSVIYDKKANKIKIFASIVKDSQQDGFAYGKLLKYDLKTDKKIFEATLYRGGETYFYGIMPFNFYRNKDD